MNKIKSLVLLTGLIIIMAGFGLQDDGLRGINPVSYSDVAYVSVKDTVITSTLAGAIYLETKGNYKKKLLVKLDDEINAIAYSEKTKKIFAATPGLGVFVIDYPSGKVITNLKTGKSCLSLDIDPEKDLLAAGCTDGKVLIWDLHNQYSCDTLKGKSPAFAVRLFDNSNRLAIAGYNISVWDRNARKMIKQVALGDAHAIRDVDVEKNGMLLAGASLDKVAGIFTLSDYSLYKSFSHPDYPYEMSPGKYVNIPPSMAIVCSKFLGNKLITAGGDRTVRSWDIESASLLKTFTGHKGAVSALAVSATAGQVASVDLKGKLLFWNLE